MNWRALLGGSVAVGLGLCYFAGTSHAQFPPLADPVTHYLCYKPKVVVGHPDVLTPTCVIDQFGSDCNSKIKAKPKLFCNPALKNGASPGPPFRPNDHLKCYKYKRKLPAAITVQASNQFGLETLSLQKTKMLCLPTEKN